MARVEGFEPPTAWFVARYSIQLSYTRVNLCTFEFYLKRWRFKISGACGRIRTSDRLVRSQVLYPAELHTRKTCCWPPLPTNNGGEGGIRTLDTRICVWFLSRELVSATHPPLLDCGVHFTDSLA